MKTISINFILHNRFEYFFKSVKELFNISEKLKSQVVLNLLISNYNSNLENNIKEIKNNNLEVSTFLIKGGNNYLTKIQTAIDNSGEYAVSIDEDIFIPSKTWEYFLSNLSILNDSNNLFLSPIISTGIPSVDLFSSQFLSNEEKNKLENFYHNTNIPNIWGADYSNLNKFTTESNYWDYEAFYKEVNEVNHYYKGVHPIRFSYDAQNFLNNLCIENIDKICNLKEFSMVKIKKPYFCNSVFGIKVDTWKKIIDDKSLFKDEFDEVPLNLYMKNNNLEMLFINNGFAIHPSYNTINIYGHNYADLSDKFFNCNYFNK